MYKRQYAAVGFEQRCPFGRGSVVDAHAVVEAACLHGLNDAIAAELAEVVDGAADGERRRRRTVEGAHRGFDGAVELHNIVVDTPEGLDNVGAPQLCRIAQYAYLRLGIEAVAHGNSVVDNGGEVGMERRLAVAREGDDVERVAGGVERRKTFAEQAADIGACRQARRAGALGVLARLAVETVEAAHLAVVGRQIDPQRRSEAPRPDRPENSRME